MFVNNINPTLITLGQFQIRYYGLIYAFGFLLAILFLRYFARKGYVKLKDDEIYDLVFWLIIGIVVGARIFEVFIWNPGYYFANPGQMLAIWRGGLSFHGAFAGAIAAMYFFCKKHNLSFMRMADLIVIPAALAVALGRIGNFLNSELYGYPTDVSWCVVFKRVDDICRHPYQLYSAIKRTLIFGILFYLNTKKHRTDLFFGCSFSSWESADFSWIICGSMICISL